MEKNIWGWVVGALIIGGLIGYFAAPATRQAQRQEAPAVTAKGEENKALARGIFEAVDTGNLDGMDALFSEDYVFHLAGNPPLNRQAHRQLVESLRGGLPDVKHTIEAQVAEGDWVSTRGFFEATHKGELLGIKATGKPVKVTFIQIVRFADGKIAEEWINFDQLGLLQQIGVFPAPAPSR